MICVLVSLVLWGLFVGIAAASPPVHANVSEPLDSIETTKPKEDPLVAVETPPPVAPGQEVRKIEAALRAEGIRVAQIGQMGEAGTGVQLSQHGQIADLPYFNRDEVARLFAGGQ